MKRIIFVFVIIGVLMGVYFLYPQTSTKQIATKIVTTSIDVEVAGRLDNALFSKKTLAVTKGERLSISANGVLVKKDKLKTSYFPFTETLAFTIPGEKGNYFLGECEQTVIEVRKSGNITFSLDYPQNTLPLVGEKLFAYKHNAQTGILSTTGEDEKNQRHLASIMILQGTESFSGCLPTKVERLDGVLGMMFPDIEVSRELEEKIDFFEDIPRPIKTPTAPSKKNIPNYSNPKQSPRLCGGV